MCESKKTMKKITRKSGFAVSGLLAGFGSLRMAWLAGILFGRFLVFGGQSNDVDAFKDYLAHPPCVSRLVYSEAQHCEEKRRAQLVLSWCGNGYFVRQVGPFENIDLPISQSNRMRGAFFAGSSGDLRWQISGFGVGESISPNPEAPDQYTAFSDSMKVIAGGVVNLGSQMIVPGTFVWDGDAFEATPSPHLQRTPPIDKVKGKIHTENGRVVRMDLANTLTSYHYEYEASSNRPSWFPSKVTTLIDGACVKSWRFESVALGRVEDMAEQFVPEYHIAQGVELVTVISNNQVILAPKGTDPKVITLIRQQFPDQKPAGETLRQNQIARIVVGLVLAIPLVVILWHFGLRKKKI